MNTLMKRTFDDGSFLELFRRNDNTHRIKFVSFDGDEVTLNIATKGWAKSHPTHEYDDIITTAQDLAASMNCSMSVAVAGVVLVRCGHLIREGAALACPTTEVGFEHIAAEDIIAADFPIPPEGIEIPVRPQQGQDSPTSGTGKTLA